MSVLLALQAGQAIAGGVQALQARKAAATAQEALDAKKAQFAALDTSNPYANMENVYEDLTIDQRAAQFQTQQEAQSQANIMQQMKATAGSSGIAALAQSLANRGALSSQQAAASIGQQERTNQMKTLGETSRLQDLNIKGELMSRQAEFDKLDTLMGFDASDLASAQQQQMAGSEAMWGGIAGVAGGLAGLSGGDDDDDDGSNTGSGFPKLTAEQQAALDKLMELQKKGLRI